MSSTKPVRRGDIIWADASPTTGSEQHGDRPHLVLTNQRFHTAYQLAIVIPATTAGVRGRPALPTWVANPDGSGHFMVEQVRAMALQRVRRVQAADLCDVVAQVFAILTRLVTEGDR